MPLTARDVSYARTARTRSARALIRLMENSTGRLGLLRRAGDGNASLSRDNGIFDSLVAQYGLTLDVVGGSLLNIPRSGPLVVVANHPYGILDGLILGHILARRRDGFRIMANSAFNLLSDLNRHLLPVSFDRDKAALALNLNTRRTALEGLAQGGAVGVFPGGTVSTGRRMFSRPMDPGWGSFTARMIAKSQATVVPVYFDGHTSRLFQIASHVHQTLRMGLLIREFRKRVDTPVRVVIGEPIGRNVLNPLEKDPKAMMDFLRKATYELSPDPARSFDLGFEF